MLGYLIYNQKTALWGLFCTKQDKVVYKHYDREEIEKWAASNGYARVERR